MQKTPFLSQKLTGKIYFAAQDLGTAKLTVVAGKKPLTKKHKKLCLQQLKTGILILKGLINRCLLQRAK